MRYLVCLFLFIFMVSKVNAHEMVPTYPRLSPSFVDGLSRTTVTVFNKRPEVEYYEVGVFDKDFEPIAFVSSYKVYKIPYLSTVSIDIYVKDQDKNKVTYICSRSKLRKADLQRTAVSSKICSKVKQPGE